MARYHVYGVGNALVDIEYEIPESMLGELGVDKGLMTLIEEPRHHELLGQLERLEGRSCGGGSAANTMVAAAQLGSDSFYSCKVANDATGHFFIADLASNGLATNLDDDKLEAGITGKCIVLVTPDAERSMSTFLGITREISPAALDEAALRDSSHVYIEGYLVPEVAARAAAVQAADIARQSGVPIALTLSDVNMVKFFGDGLREIIGDGIDLIFANQDEAFEMFGTTDIEANVEAMKSIAKRFAITRGSRGAVLFDGHMVTEITADKVEAIDANGAGDVYAGAFLHGLTHGMAFADCGSLAGACATKLVTRTGARLEGDEIRAIGRRFGIGR